MKRYLLLLAVLMMTALSPVTGCDKPTPDPNPSPVNPVPDPGNDELVEVEDTLDIEGAKDLLITFSAEGGSAELQVVTNCGWKAVASTGWCSVDPASGAKGRVTVTIKTAPNEATEPRTAVFTFTAGKVTREVTLEQDAAVIVIPPSLTISRKSYKADAEGKTFSVEVTSNVEYTISAPDWLDTSVAEEKGETKVYSVTAAPNDTGSDRSGSIVFENREAEVSATLKVSQEAIYVEDPECISILAIGNSFSIDAMQYLYDILLQCGYREVHLGNLYIGGCTLETHSGNLTGKLGAYIYYTNDNGTWSSTDATSAQTALSSRKWNYISMQQASGSSGVKSTYEPYLGNIITEVRKLAPQAHLMWHMTWAYQQNSTHSEFSKYDKDQMKMYNMILDAVREKVLAHQEIEFVIPCGTAVQNLRTSLIGDNVTRDGYHMAYDTGRYVTAMMWARQISGRDISGVTWKPSGYSFSEKQILAIKEAVNNAYDHPYEVTRSQYESEAEVCPPHEELAAVLKAAGYDPDNYEELQIRLTPNSFYQSTASSTVYSAATGSSASNLNQFASTPIYTKSDIPNGSVIVLKEGFQYRPEAWTSLSGKTSNRPANVYEQIVKVDDTWWGSWNYRAFNIAKKGNPALDAAGQKELLECFAIFVPKASQM
ncbi:MAG: DUF4886 domain-containing protein [Bacteroidales bacterium]|nr:DUF4886 domain-containing protein [Bacteroidales bacterium]